MSTLLKRADGVIDFYHPETFVEPTIHFSGRFPYSRQADKTVSTFSTDFGEITVGMWLGGAKKVEQQDAVFLGVDNAENLWMVVADGLGGHPGGAEASQICCDILSEEIGKVGFTVNGAFRDKVRVRMARSKLIMSNIYKTGGACIALVCINENTHKLNCYSMGDVEACVLRNNSEVVMSNMHDTGSETNQVSKSLSPSQMAEFTETEVLLKPGDKVMVASDGLANKAFRALAGQNTTMQSQIRQAIEVSEFRNGDNADNLSIICLERFLPRSNSPHIENVKLGKL